MEHVTLETTEPGIALLTLNRPDRLNALSHGLIAELHQVFDQVAADRSTTVVVLTGAGRGFCAGVDLQEMETPEGARSLDGPMRGMATQEHLSTLISHIQAIPQPVIAAVNGAAVGGGMALACACEVRVASTAAKFGTQFIKIGASGCDVGISYTLPRLIGASRAFELILTGRLVGGEEAERIGLVSRVVAPDELMEAAMEIARVIAGYSPFGVWMTKEVLWANLDAPNLETAMRLEDRTQILSLTTGDFKEAAAAFVEKRAPRFGGWDS